MPRTERDIVIGKIIAPLGTRGEVKTIVLTDFPERFETGAELSLRMPDGETRRVRLDSAEFIIDESELAELPSDRFYLFDLIGLRVATDDGREVGEVTEILQGGANDVYVTSTGLCIPALKDVVAKIDLGEGVMVIRPVPGLLD
jgi:16S rRNA processing protein RimM